MAMSPVLSHYQSSQRASERSKTLLLPGQVQLRIGNGQAGFSGGLTPGNHCHDMVITPPFRHENCPTILIAFNLDPYRFVKRIKGMVQSANGMDGI
jgi:hypothetical protein